MTTKLVLATRTLAAAALAAIAVGAAGSVPASAADEVPFTVSGWQCEWYAADEKGGCTNADGDLVSLVYRDAPSRRSDSIAKAGGRVGTIQMDVTLGNGSGNDHGVGVITAEGTIVGPKDGDGFLTVQGGGLGPNVEVAHALLWK